MDQEIAALITTENKSLIFYKIILTKYDIIISLLDLDVH